MRLCLAAILLCLPLMASPKPKVKFTTSMGIITVQLEPEAAPKTVEQFLQLVKQGFYNGTIFHRIAKTPAIVQGGGYSAPGRAKIINATLPNEGDLAKTKGLKNRKGVLSMAYPPGNPLGAKSQFFFNVKDNAALDFKAANMQDYGFCPFGKIVEGQDVVDKIAKVKLKPGYESPLEPVNLIKVEEVK
jgi:cyclophilin family peptidyl-prolyl cis-trans isomerase